MHIVSRHFELSLSSRDEDVGALPYSPPGCMVWRGGRGAVTNMGLPWRKLAGFSALPFLASISPLLLLPVLVRAVGADGWAAVAIGMSVGGAGSVVVNYGWGVLGPSIVAQTDEAGARARYRTSFVMRLALAATVSPVVFLISALVAPSSYAFAAGLTGIAFALGGLSPAWYFIGRGVPIGVALWDTLPRLAAVACCVPLLLVFANPVAFAASQLVVTGGAWIVHGVSVAMRAHRTTWAEERSSVKAALREQSPIVGSSIVSALYTSLSVTLVGIASVGAVPAFAAADRVRGMGKQAEMAIVNGLQGWVGSASLSGARRRNGTRALGLMTMIGFGSGVGLAVLLPSLAPILFGDEVHIDYSLSIPMGVALVMTGISMAATFLVLAPNSRIRTISVATTVGAVLGGPLILFGAWVSGASGAACALAVAETVVVMIEFPAAIRVLRSLPNGGI